MLAALFFAAACTKGAVIYRESHTPTHPPGYASRLEVHGTGYWTSVQAGEVGSNEAIGRSGCLDAPALAALRTKLAAAKFTNEGPCCCDALATDHIVYEAPKRKKKLSTEQPCGPGVDADTQALITLVAKTFAHLR